MKNFKEKKNGDIVEIIEDEKAVWIIENGETIEVTATYINLPDFENNKYSKILKYLIMKY
ncbi:hypothetical protein [Clostridium butyricum]|uniref:hypothetical protein n=1 Tax=Clostridium butyricum TaxID=1492 RepID=UPI0024B9F8E1|nr:hypothetical protein [Clostridium butyricum]